MKKLGGKGFSSVEVVLIVVIVGLIGVVGWLVYDRRQNTRTESTDTQLNQQTQKQEAKDETRNQIQVSRK